MSMELNSASENLQVIRTLMERAAVYRRTLAPIMLYLGTLGVLAAATGILLEIEPLPQFAALWLSTAVVAVAGAFVIARRQALKDKEAFWSAPTRRVAQALVLPLAAGLLISVLIASSPGRGARWVFILPNVLFYACAVYSAGFFMPRGIQKFAWILFALAAAGLFIVPSLVTDPDPRVDHALMGFFFGVLHLGYGLYLRVTEQRKTAT
jgi:hypothetical protein